jgi:gluconokinase
LHSPSNIDAMSRGIPPTDDTRAPWLEDVHARMRESSARGEHLVVACSALKERYRRVLSDGLHVTWVYLKGSPDLIRKRMEERPHHYMRAGLLESQFAALEEPAGAIVADITPPPAVIIEHVAAALSQRGVN